MRAATVSELLVRAPVSPGSESAFASGFAAADFPFDVDPLFEVDGAGGMGITAADRPRWRWYVARPKRNVSGQNAWDLAHDALSASLGIAAGPSIFVEPDLTQDWLPLPPASVRGVQLTAPVCAFEDQNPKLPHVDAEFAWHLGDDYSQLRAARQAAGANPTQIVRVAHLDTGYDDEHSVLRTANLRPDLARDFVASATGKPGAIDPGNPGFMHNPGHGTATLSLIAGGSFIWTADGYHFADVIGGAPPAHVIPVRVGNSVVQIKTSSVAAGINYAAQLARGSTPVHVISMSMGGVASLAWADAVNKAYDAGIIFVAAAGNNFSAGIVGLPTRFVVYPARFRRVIAACGVMADRRPYYGLPYSSMQGNWGPTSKMATALAAFTPNLPWAKWHCAGIVNMDGEGTSAATPQIASAAALYLQKHFGALFDPARYPDPWMRVEAIRHALFTAADKVSATGNEEKVGNGILQAARALDVPPIAAAALQRCPEDHPSFPFLRVLTGLGVATSPANEMLALESTQLAQRSWGNDVPNPFETEGSDPDAPWDAVPVGRRRIFLEALLAHPEASTKLKQRLTEILGALPRPPTATTGQRKRADVRGAESKQPVPEQAAAFMPADPPIRCLRGFAIDPSLATRLDTASISEVTFRVPWEDLQPGPVGEYLEVIDVDPASGCNYEPVDLNDRRILAQDGLPPSEGTPQFHQQMVYAVARLTIQNFERALGRRTLWRNGPPPEGTHEKNDSHFVRRLRIYPHALRDANAYYSPSKIALLFGYFNATSANRGENLPQGRVFSCLSHDIIAHETTHALLDGMHRRFIQPTNPDVLAFHEAFADIVALFQHFTFPQIVRHQINSTRGAMRTHQNLLSELAGQFGRAIGNRGALRSAIGEIRDGRWVPAVIKPTAYEETVEPHDRGAILVGAVFDAFLSIYERRTADLLRLATGGSGELATGAIHPDLAERLANESAKAAGHVLGMCVRAIDYLPPLDVTFGEYLRALITADADLVPDDDLNYRVSFIDAFRRRGIYPHNVRTLSVESLRWRASDEDAREPTQKIAVGLGLMRNYAEANLYATSREEIFHLQRNMRRALHEWLKEHFKDPDAGHQDARFLGLDHNLPFEVHTARFAYRVSPDGDMKPQLLVGILQDHQVPVDPVDPKGEMMVMEGGCTIVADLRQRSIGYCIRKSLTSQDRLARQRAFVGPRRSSTRAIYLGPPAMKPGEETFAALHRNH